MWSPLGCCGFLAKPASTFRAKFRSSVLTAAVWTRDLNVALRAMRRIEAGTVWINSAGQHFVGTPFGGWKNSGLGGEECLDELLGYTQLKAVHVLP